MACANCGGTTRKGSARAQTSTCACQDGAVTWPCTPALPGGLVRTRFFEGMALERRDLADEQRFWIDKRRLTNRALGTGVVWGLRTRYDQRSGTVQIQPGYALDCCGRDLVLTDCHVVETRALLDRRQPAIAKILSQAKRGGAAKAHLVLRYEEVPEEPRGVSADACAPSTHRTYEPSRMRESAAVCVVEVPDAPQDSPLDGFREQLQELLRQPGKTARPVAERATTGVRETDEPQIAHDTPLILRIHVRGEVHTAVARPAADDGTWVFDDLEPLAVAASGGADDSGSLDIDLELRAAPGWALVAGQVQGTIRNEDRVLAEVRAPADLSLAWSLQVLLSKGPDRFTHRFDVRGLVVAKLFSPTERVSFETVDLAVQVARGFQRTGSNGTRPENDGTVLSQVVVDVESEGSTLIDADARLPEPDCLAPLSDLVDDPRPLALAALYAWLRRGVTDDDSGQTLLAWWAWVVAWRLLYGVDPGDPERAASLHGLFRDLLLRWCEGFVYPGPRCPTDHQGVVLGTLTLSRSGQVQSFSAWEGRRHVLTGPLLEHWLGQLGIAAPDVMVGRILEVICCVGEGHASPLVDLVHWTQRDMDKELSTYGTGAIGLSGGAHVLVGTDDDIDALLTRRGWTAVRRDEVAPWQLAQLLAGSFAAPAPPGPHRVHYVVAGAKGRRLHLLVPASEADLQRVRASEARLREAVDAALVAVDAQPGPLGEAPLSDFAWVLARDLQLPGVKSVESLVAELRRVHEPSLGDALAMGPEGLHTRLQLLTDQLVPAEQVNDLWNASEKELADAMKRVWKAVASWSHDHGPLTRRGLLNADLHQSIADALVRSSRGERYELATLDDVEAAATQAAAMP